MCLQFVKLSPFIKKGEVQKGKQIAPGPHISGGGRTPMGVPWVSKHDIACEVEGWVQKGIEEKSGLHLRASTGLE